MFLLIDNYDSFTYNLVQAFLKIGKKPVVLKNDDPELLNMAKREDLEMVCISPGPGHPDNAGLCMEFLKELDTGVPVLGVCLGHQILGRFAGADVSIAPTINHGKQSEIAHNGSGLFKNLPNPVTAGRYHSLVVKPDEKTEEIISVTAYGPEGEVMALQYKDRPWVGVQFHPESVLTPEGNKILENFPSSIIENKTKKTPFSIILETLAQKKDLDAEMAETGFSALMDGELSSAQAASFLMGLRMKGESPLELATAVQAALARAVKVKGFSDNTIDIVGTGGDGKHSFNCSTATALIMASMGYKVVKHGNRAISSTCGAADAIEALGINLNSDPEAAMKLLETIGFTFFFAPYYHPSFKNIGPIRKELGIRTLFNILGPMINPAHPSHLLMGVARKELVKLVAETLTHSGLKRAAVVCGAGGYDEMTPMGPANIAYVENGAINWKTLDPIKYGIKPCSTEDLAVQTKEEAVSVLKEILKGAGPAPMMEMVMLNLAIALSLMEKDWSMSKCMEKAREAVYSGKAARNLENA